MATKSIFAKLAHWAIIGFMPWAMCQVGLLVMAAKCILHFPLS